MADPFDIFLVCVPGLEDMLAAEAAELGFAPAQPVPGGVEIQGGWAEVWRANLWLRGATRVLVRLGDFAAPSLGALEEAARRFEWVQVLKPRQPVRIDVTCRASRIAHAGAATTRIERALRAVAIPVMPDAAVTLKLRIEHNRCLVSVDSSGAPLHKRGHKEAVGKAPLRETMAALFLRRAGYRAGEAVVDPFCGSGTLPIEAAEIAEGRAPGRSRSFAFESFAGFEAQDPPAPPPHAYLPPGSHPGPRCAQVFGFDRDAGAIRNATANAARAGVAATFAQRPVATLVAPEVAPGLVICNPPYGARIGNPKALHALYATLGDRLRASFGGWRVAIVTSDAGLAASTRLPFLPRGAPVAHGGLKVWLFRTDPL